MVPVGTYLTNSLPATAQPPMTPSFNVGAAVKINRLRLSAPSPVPVKFTTPAVRAARLAKVRLRVLPVLAWPDVTVLRPFWTRNWPTVSP